MYLMLVDDSTLRKWAQLTQNYFISNLGNIISLHLLNQCLFIVFPISTTPLMILYSFIYQIHYDMLWPVQRSK